MAVFTLLSGFFGFLIVPALVALVLGLIVLLRRRPGRVMAVIGMLLAVAWLASLVLFLRSDTFADFRDNAVSTVKQEGVRDSSGALTKAAPMLTNNLRVGDCFSDRLADSSTTDTVQIGTVQGMPCTLPHNNEVYHVGTLPDGPYPGTNAIAEQVEAQCTESFASFVGKPYDESTLDIFYIYPQQLSWTKDKDRTLTCSVTTNSTETGSLKGSGR